MATNDLDLKRLLDKWVDELRQGRDESGWDYVVDLSRLTGFPIKPHPEDTP